jgi:glycosyltransferase involved in cell wall biosynthesis
VTRHKPRVLFVAPHPVEGPSTRFRICQFLPHLEAVGIGCQLRPFLSSRLAPVAYRPGGIAGKLGVTAWGAAQRLADIGRAARCDLIYVLREAFPIGPPWLESAMRHASGRLVFDFDDAIWHRALNFNNPLDRLRDWDRPAKIISTATRVVAGSEGLAGYARERTTDPARVVVLPTVVDTARFRPCRRDADGTIVVGWIGTPRNTYYLRWVWPALAEAARRDRRIRFVLVGADIFPTEGAPVEFRPWNLAREIADIQSFDIGIMPLTDDVQARGKCGFKLIEYMACGIASVASPIGANVEVLRDGVTGLLADSNTEWVVALQHMVGDRDMRRAMGIAARTRAEAEFSTAVIAPRFVQIIREALAS